MKLLDSAFDIETFLRRAALARERLLLLDYDGTLAPFHRRPEDAMPYAGVPEVLGRLARDGRTRVVIVSGRRLVDLRGPLTRIPHAGVWGTHGWEHLTAGGERIEFQPEASARRRLQLAEPAARRLAMLGARVERKGASVAIHWRGLREPNRSEVRERIGSEWRAHAGALDLLEFDGGLELRARGRTKADAVRDALASSAPGCACAYLGDDLTDEDAFAAIAGRGLAVLVRPEWRETAANVWIRPPGELLEFLERWCGTETA